MRRDGPRLCSAPLQQRCAASGARDPGWIGQIHISNSGHAFAFSRRVPPELCSSRHALSEERAQGRPGAG